MLLPVILILLILLLLLLALVRLAARIIDLSRSRLRRIFRRFRFRLLLWLLLLQSLLLTLLLVPLLLLALLLLTLLLVQLLLLFLLLLFLLLFACFMSRNVVAHGNLFFENLKAQLQLERQTEIISLLLKEFQENASDWLWQTDAEGHLIHVPERFAAVAQLPLPLLRGAPFAHGREF